MNRSSRWYVAALAFLCIASSPARAQTVMQSGDTAKVLTCAHNPSSPGAYANCNLRIKANVLKRGDQGEVLGRRHFMRPIPIKLFVFGDSAQRYALAYHRSEIVHASVAMAAAVLLASSIVAGHNCLNSLCRGTPSRPFVRTALIAGLALVPVSIGLKIHTNRLGQKSLDFYNASLGR